MGVVMASVLAGCGSGSSGLNLTAYLVHGSQETGFSTQGAPSVVKSLNSYLASQYGAGSDPTKLKAEGFKEFATVGTGGPNAEQGGSFALELGSPSAAVHEQAASPGPAGEAWPGRGEAGAVHGSWRARSHRSARGGVASNLEVGSDRHEGTCVLWGRRFGLLGPVARRGGARTHLRAGRPLTCRGACGALAATP